MYKIVKSPFLILLLLLISLRPCSAQTFYGGPSSITNLPMSAPTQPAPSLSAGLQQIWDAASVSTNFAAAFGGGRATSGNKNLAFAEFCYNFNANVGLVVGYDYLWTAREAGIPSSANLVKGGLTLHAPIKPLKQFGFDKFTVVPFGFMLVATGNGSASEVMGGGLQTKILSFKGFNLNTGVIYEKRTDAGYWNGNYVAGFLGISKGF